MSPRVSVIFTSYNHAPYVEQALDSLVAQTCADFELVITDDCSADDTVERIERWLARNDVAGDTVYNTENVGICAVRNRALARSSGEYVVSLAGDDWYEPDRLERQVAFFDEQHAGTAYVYGDARRRDAAGRVLRESYLAGRLPLEPSDRDSVYDALLAGDFIAAPAVMIRKAAIEAVGGYDESLNYDDYDMWLRLTARFDVAHCPGVVTNWRYLPSSLSNSQAHRRNMLESTLEIVARLADEPLVAGDERRRRIVARHLRDLARRETRYDLEMARDSLEEAGQLSPSRAWRAFEAGLALPGFGRSARLYGKVRNRVRRARWGLRSVLGER